MNSESTSAHTTAAVVEDSPLSGEPVDVPAYPKSPILSDESTFAVMSMELPADHWLYAQHDNVPPMGLRMGTDHPQRAVMRDHLVQATQYAIRAATMNGSLTDFDPDALVQNLVVGLLGYNTPNGLGSESWQNPPNIPATVPDRTKEPDYKTMYEAEVAARNGAYTERNHVVAALARAFPSGIRQTEIEGWDPEWNGCVFIDLPTGQISYHYHSSEAHLFSDLPAYNEEWDGHDKSVVHARLASLGFGPDRRYLEQYIAAHRNVAASLNPDLRAEDIHNLNMWCDKLESYLTAVQMAHETGEHPSRFWK